MLFVSKENHAGGLLMSSLQFVEVFLVLWSRKLDAGSPVHQAKEVITSLCRRVLLLFKEPGIPVASPAASIQGHNLQILFSKLVPSLDFCKGFSIPSAGLCVGPFQISRASC